MKKLILLGLLFCTPVFAASYETGFNHDVQYVDTFAAKMEKLGGNLQNLFDYGSRTDGQAVYVGQAVQGTLTSAANWIVYHYTYDVGNNVTSKKTAYGAWDNRASLSYT